MGDARRTDRAGLIQKHVAARAKRDAAQLGSEEYRAAAEEIARIEVAIAKMEEPPPASQPQGNPKAGEAARTAR